MHASPLHPNDGEHSEPRRSLRTPPPSFGGALAILSPLLNYFGNLLLWRTR